MSETTVIIRTFNEERHLPALFDALAAQAYRDFEVVVVDSGSFDRTREIASRHTSHVLRIRPDDFTFGYSLNVGIGAASGQFLAIVSAHTIPTGDGWLSSLIAPLGEQDVAMVYGRQIGHDVSKFAESRDFLRTFGESATVLEPPHFFANNANSAIRSDLWRQHRFDETLTGLEDIEWARHWMERGYRVYYEPRACIHHIHEETWPQVRRRYYREAVALKRMGLVGRRDLPLHLWRELGFAAADLGSALVSGQFTRRAGEIVRFRAEKAMGTMKGVYDGAGMDERGARTEALFEKHCEAVVIEGAGVARLRQVDLPALKPGEVLIRVAYEGICHTDLEILDGRLGYYLNGLAQYPIVPGHEFSGTVVAVGSRCDEVKEGARVVVECIQGCGTCASCHRGNAIGCAERREVGVIRCNGGYAEYVVTPARFAHTIPDDLALDVAFLAEPLAVVLKGLRKLAPFDAIAGGGRYAVVGAGPIGHLTARVLVERGVAVTVFDRDPRRLTYFADGAVDTRAEPRDLDPFTVIVEATGDPEVLHGVLHASTPGTTVLLLGLPYARREFSFETIVGYDKTIVGSVGSGAQDFDQAVALLPRLNTRSLRSVVMPLSQFARAWELARSREHLKIVLQIDS